MSFPIRILCAVLLLLAAATAMAEMQIRTIPLRHRPAGELLPVLEPLVGEGGSLSAYRNKLILRDSPENLDAIEALVEELDRKVETLRVRVRQGRSRGGTGGGGGVRLSAGAASASLEVGGRRRTLGNLQRTTEQFLLVEDGETAVFNVGREVPFTRELAVFAGENYGYAETVDFREVTTGFSVRPHLRGEEVLLEIAPRISFLDPGEKGVLDFQSLTTRVVVPLGVWFDLGGQLLQSDGVSRAILLRAGKEMEERSVWVRVERR